MTPEESSALVRKLSKRLSEEQTALRVVDGYYAGTQPLAFLAPEVRDSIGNRLAPLVINWPRVIVGAIEERLDVEGFRLGSDEDADAELWRIWQANELDEWSQLGHIDAMVHGRSYVSVWADDEDPSTPRIAFESASQMVVSYVSGTRTIDAALKVWRDDGVQTAMLYLPDTIERYEAPAPKAAGTEPRYEFKGALENPLGRVPIVPFVNRPRLMALNGESELTDVMPMADAVNKLATDLMVTSEFSATKRRWATGIEIPKEGGSRRRLQAEVKAEWDEATKGKTWLAGSGVNFGEFSEASLENFTGAIKMLTSQIAAIAGLPPHHLGINADNPASADAIRSAESSLIKKAERKQRSFGGSYERVMRLAAHVRDGQPSDELRDLETIWRDPATPTPAQKADAALKLTTGDRPIITVGQAREDLGYSPGQVQRMKAEEDEAVAASATADVRARVEEAKHLMTDQGLSQSAAYAAVGLLVAASQISADATGPSAA